MLTLEIPCGLAVRLVDASQEHGTSFERYCFRVLARSLEEPEEEFDVTAQVAMMAQLYVDGEVSLADFLAELDEIKAMKEDPTWTEPNSNDG